MPICAGCGEKVDNEDCIKACNKDWHSICFKCSVCLNQVVGTFFEKDDLIYCQKDYWSAFGEKCHDCKQFISGPVMVAGEHKFHPECFKCDSCSNFIEDGKSFALVERTRLYCAACYKQQMSPLAQKLPFANEPHSIKLVEIPAHTDTCNKKVKISVDCCQNQKVQHGFHELHISDVVLNKDLMSLHIGDRILEVNGTPLQNHSLQEIKKLIQTRDKPVQLTVEHEPAVLIRSRSMNFSSHLETSKFLSNQHVLPKCSLSHRPAEQRLRRSSSLPRSFIRDFKSSRGQQPDFTRTRSFRVQPKNQQIFRPSDLVLGKLLGRGFFGQAFLVTHRHTGQEMVMKEIYRLDEEAQQNFVKEIAVLRSLQHRNVLRFVGVLYKDKKLHLLTEFISGGTLQDIIHDLSVDLSWLQRINFSKDIAAGMAYLHSKSIIHRDLNSNNCLVRKDKSVVVADFGLARVMLDRQLSRKQNAGSTRRPERKKRYTVVGNPYWMAPEMMSHKKYDERVDIFSFGIILCEIIGRVPADPDYLPRSSDFGLNVPAFKEKFCEGCPEPFSEIAFKCCDIFPEKRPVFRILKEWLEAMSLHLGIHNKLPDELVSAISNFSSQPDCEDESSPDGYLSPPYPLLRTFSEQGPCRLSIDSSASIIEL